MRFEADPRVFERFPGTRVVVAVARGLDNQTQRPDVEARWQTAWEEAGRAGAAYGNAQSHPRVRPWRERFTAMGVSGKLFPSSIEALLRRALKGGEPFHINSLVDWYNSISLRHTVPAGGFDLADIADPLELRLTRLGDHFTALDAGEAEAVAAGEVAYADGATILTRHFVWRQSRAGLIAPTTREVVLVSEVLGEVGEETAEAVRSDFVTGLRDSFGVESVSGVVDARHLTFSE